jgi:parvulin-like peptidyl-prolyl isomerase
MTKVFQIGSSVIDLEDLPSLLSRYELLPQLFSQLVISQAIATIEFDSDQKAIAVARFCQQHKLETESEKSVWLQKHGMTLAEMEFLALRPLLLDKFKLATFGPKVESYFMSRKINLDRVIYSLIRTKDFNLAQELYFRIQGREDTFENLARQYSEGVEANTGGVIGPTLLSNPHAAIAQMLAVSQPGQLWGPIQVEDWAIILRLDKSFPAQLDEATRQQMINELFEQWLQQQVKQVQIFGFSK